MADKLKTLTPSLQQDLHPARMWQALPNGRVQCHLSPRKCRIPVGGLGFCGVRYNQDGRLMTVNYGKSVPVTEERIESEAVYHYAPGARILSLGNIGCMLKCDFCQNWQTSQARLVRDQDVARYTPEQVIDYALRHDIGILSWTYNDPVVWHEFVMDTARLGRQAGLKNLYKSAFAIGPEAIDELLEVMDIFSISLKSMDAAYYRKFTRGEMQPVLDGILQVFRARQGGQGPHLELSNLCLTGRNDNLTEARRVCDWMLDKLDDCVPLHYVRFHPDYLYTHVERTSVEFLEAARWQALDAGLKYVYIGNTSGTASVDTYCPSCGHTAIRRSGGTLEQTHDHGRCGRCGYQIPIFDLPPAAHSAASADGRTVRSMTHVFRGAIGAAHVEQATEARIRYVFLDEAGTELGSGQSSCLRFLVSRPGPRAAAVRIDLETDTEIRIMEVFDRAHFPTATVQQSERGSCDVPPALIAPR
jgi:pyruvate formate lyase activating enzyme